VPSTTRAASRPLGGGESSRKTKGFGWSVWLYCGIRVHVPARPRLTPPPKSLLDALQHGRVPARPRPGQDAAYRRGARMLQRAAHHCVDALCAIGVLQVCMERRHLSPGRHTRPSARMPVCGSGKPSSRFFNLGANSLAGPMTAPRRATPPARSSSSPRATTSRSFRCTSSGRTTATGAGQRSGGDDGATAHCFVLDAALEVSPGCFTGCMDPTLFIAFECLAFISGCQATQHHMRNLALAP